MRKKNILLVLAAFVCPLILEAQDERKITLGEAIALARTQSVDAAVALNELKTSYWEYRTFRADLLPEVNLTGTLPNYNKSYNSYQNSDGTYGFVRNNYLGLSGDLSIDQNIWFTGGKLSLTTSLDYIKQFGGEGKEKFMSVPVSLELTQPIFGVNKLKWDRRIEPLRYREARKAYAEALELVASETSTLFFNLATAQTNLDIATYNYASADTLYRYAEGRYNIGTITENEMLQLEINKLTEETNMMNARIEVEDQMQTLRSFLGINREINLRVVPENSIPQFEISLQKALQLAFKNSPDPDTYKRKQLESRSALASAKANAGLKADLYVQFGLSQTGNKFADSYRNPMNQQYASIGISLPILDWGRGKGRVRVARSNVDLVDTQAEQGMKDFELNVCKMVRQFNLQAYRVAVAAKTDKTADRRHDVARRLYILGKSTILDLNAAITEKDTARRNYITALKTYWSLYYGLRSMTGYDFLRKAEISCTIPKP